MSCGACCGSHSGNVTLNLWLRTASVYPMTTFKTCLKLNFRILSHLLTSTSSFNSEKRSVALAYMFPIFPEGKLSLKSNTRHLNSFLLDLTRCTLTSLSPHPTSLHTWWSLPTQQPEPTLLSNWPCWLQVPVASFLNCSNILMVAS